VNVILLKKTFFRKGESNVFFVELISLFLVCDKKMLFLQCLLTDVSNGLIFFILFFTNIFI